MSEVAMKSNKAASVKAMSARLRRSQRTDIGELRLHGSNKVVPSIDIPVKSAIIF